ncbi:DUF2207 domain-containing protein [uncultured Tessaracoccus sp.]|uniref:DUF2207 domain-containing protein n=1 Tax=uncultured Tessaracoccus sp. TaxID=905023 RepID=UPI00261313D0|nr:DUF2207 domain-containing protein [uncultured Tessaracoccus sp.]
MTKRRIFALLAGLLVFFMAAPAAHAEGSTPYRDIHVDVRLDEQGTAHVAMEFTMEFDRRPGRGPALQFFTTQKDGKNPDEEYVFDFSKPRVSSPTGARTDLDEERGMHAVVWRIGSKDVRYREPQQYKLEFTVKGIAWDDHPESGLAEFSWQIFSDLDSRFTNFDTTLSGPVAVEKAACFTGVGNRTKCAARIDSGKAHVHVDSVPVGQGIQLVAGFPKGTFNGATPSKRRIPTLGSNLTPGVVPGATAGGLAAVAAIGTWVMGRRAKRDLVYLGLTPGLAPAEGEDAPVGLRNTSKIPVAVQFQPPADATPGEIGTLIDATADSIDVSATIIDLAVRGYIQIIPSPSGKEFTLRALGKSTKGLRPFERSLLGTIFRGQPTRSTQDLRDERFHDVVAQARAGLYNAMTANKWFVQDPRTSGAKKASLGGVIALAGAGLGWLLFERSLALLGLPLVVLGIGLVFVGMTSKRRTARGSAMLQQARGFELYLRTAEADQIKFEEGIDVFSRYLPFAMVFGTADRWATTFEQLEREGRYRADRSWIAGDAPYDVWFYSSMANSFASSFSESVNAASAAHASVSSSGGSGFSGGGGFGGGSAGSW